MEFIRVTLVEKLVSGKHVNSLKRTPEHLMPLAAIKSIVKKTGTENTYLIGIRQDFYPDAAYDVAYAEAELPATFIQQIN